MLQCEHSSVSHTFSLMANHTDVASKPENPCLFLACKPELQISVCGLQF